MEPRPDSDPTKARRNCGTKAEPKGDRLTAAAGVFDPISCCVGRRPVSPCFGTGVGDHGNSVGSRAARAPPLAWSQRGPQIVARTHTSSPGSSISFVLALILRRHVRQQLLQSHSTSVGAGGKLLSPLYRWVVSPAACWSSWADCPMTTATRLERYRWCLHPPRHRRRRTTSVALEEWFAPKSGHVSR